MSADTKACRICREPIAADAKRCAKCQAWQSRWAAFWNGGSTQSFAQQIVWITIMIVVMFATWRYFMFPQGAEFQAHRQDVVFAGHNLTFGNEKDREYFAVVGTIKNNSDIAWRDIYVEARFLDAKSELIDAYSSNLRDVIVQPKSEAAFRLTGYTSRPSKEYSKVTLKITSAKEKSWRDW
jgi:hypothetical protein